MSEKHVNDCAKADKQHVDNVQQLDAENLDRRAHLKWGGGFIPALLYDETETVLDRKFKNNRLRELFRPTRHLVDADTWLHTFVYAGVAGLNTAFFTWLTPSREEQLPFGIRRVQLASSGLDHLDQLFAGLEQCDRFVAHIEKQCSVLHPAPTTQRVKTLISQYSHMLKKQLLEQFDFFRKPPTMIAAIAGPFVRCCSLGTSLNSELPDADSIFSDNLLFRRSDTFISTDADNKVLVRSYANQFDAAMALPEHLATGMAKWWRHEVAVVFFGKDKSLRKLLDKYTNDTNLKMCSDEMTPVRKKLIELFVTPHLTTQVIEGVHGYMTIISKHSPYKQLPSLAQDLSVKLNGIVSKDEFIRRLRDQKTEIKEFVATKKFRHRTDVRYHTFWNGQIAACHQLPVLTPKQKKMWTEPIDYKTKLAKPFLTLVKKLVPTQLWLGKRVDPGPVRVQWCTKIWQEIFLVEPAMIQQPVEFKIKSVDPRSTDMCLEMYESHQLDRFIGSTPGDLMLLDLLVVDVKNGKATLPNADDLDGSTAPQSLLQHKLDCLHALDVSDCEQREAESTKRLAQTPKEVLAWTICGKWALKFPISGYYDLLKLPPTKLKYIWENGVRFFFVCTPVCVVSSFWMNFTLLLTHVCTHIFAHTFLSGVTSLKVLQKKKKSNETWSN